MYQTDSLCATFSYGSTKEQFLKFAARHDGSVMLTDQLNEKLSSYFQQKFKAYQSAAEKTWRKYEKQLNRLNNIADAKTKEHEIAIIKQSNRNFQDEFCINLTKAYRQTGVAKTCNDTIPPPAKKYYNVIISTTGWKNLDQYVFGATQNRESMTYTDPATGTTATLVYKQISIKIASVDSFDKVMVYLIPHELNSFQRIQKKEDKFTENLNMLLKYDAIILAYKGTDAFFAKQTAIQPTEYLFTLNPINEAALRDEISNYQPDKSVDFITEIAYQLFEEKESIRQLNLQKERDIKEQIMMAIFPCADFGR
jgi:hypothetical protein